MIIGITATTLTFVSLIICIASYYLYYKRSEEQLLNLARISFYFASLLILVQAGLLMWGIHTHQFQWQYVFSYSSRDLSAFYLTSTFWAGQEGTFILWLLMGSIYGAIIIKKKFKSESLLMGFLALVQVFIIMILVKKNPFSYVWDVNPNHFQSGMIPIDGNGLNPLLQDPWMIIHPPVLFVGYSSTMILFAFAMTALIKKDYNDWIKGVFPYVLFTALALGTGIILGGYWAYTTLGWGGYWGWDPVENSSFIPWIASLALIHGIIVQRRHGGMKKTNIFLALLTFLLVLWGSFLTRSGVLSDFSVHSFIETEINNYLIAFVVLFLGIALLTFLFRIKEVQVKRVSDKFFTRESFMLFGILSLILSAILTFFGTSAPLFTGLFFGQASNVSIEYYTLLNVPIAILLGIFISISPVLNWKKDSGHHLHNLKYYISISILITISAYILGLKDIIPIIIFFFFILAILVNSEMIIKMSKGKKWGFGGYLSHVGIGFMIIGIITSSKYEKIVKETLPLGSVKKIMDYEMKYSGIRKGQDGKDEAIIEVRQSNSAGFEATPKLYWSKFNQAYMRNPYVQNLWIKDLYIAPIQVISPEQTITGIHLQLHKGNSTYFEDYQFKFMGYEINEHELNSDDMQIAAILNVSLAGQQHVIKPAIRVNSLNKELIPAKLPNAERDIYINNIDVEAESITLLVNNNMDQLQHAESGKELLAIELTEKPLINVLWIGTIIMIFGLLTSMINRSYKNRL